MTATLGVVAACRNRAAVSKRNLELARQSSEMSGCRPLFFLVDDGSNDETPVVLRQFVGNEGVLVQGDGSLYWAGAMRAALKVVEDAHQVDYVLLLNDDTSLWPDAVERLLHSLNRGADIAVGCTTDALGRRTYGGLSRGPIWDRLRFAPAIGGKCETMNFNCVLMSLQVYRSVGGLSESYTHGLADIDFGLRASKRRLRIEQTERVGVCEKNAIQGTWIDSSLPRKVRWRRLQSPKGLPWREWTTFAKRHGGIKGPWYAIAPAIRILIGK